MEGIVTPTPESAASAAAGGVDVQILGIGANGHVGFNEPGSSLSSRTRLKRLTAPLTASCRGSILQWHADAVVVLDEAAAAGLANREYYDDAARGLALTP